MECLSLSPQESLSSDNLLEIDIDIGHVCAVSTSSWAESSIVTVTSSIQGDKIFQHCTCPAGRVTYNFHLSFKSVCNKEHKGVICNMTSSPTGRVLWEELLVLSRFHS